MSSEFRRDFGIWGITNAFGLVLIFAGVIGPSGVAQLRSDFFPLGNSMRTWFMKKESLPLEFGRNHRIYIMVSCHTMEVRTVPKTLQSILRKAGAIMRKHTVGLERIQS